MPEPDATTSPVRAALDRLQDLDMTGVPEAEQIQRLTVQRDQARSEVVRLGHLLLRLRRLEVELPPYDVEPVRDALRASLRGDVVRDIAHMMADAFRATGATHVVALTLTDPRDHEEYELLLQRKAGRTPSDLLGEARTELATLRARLAAVDELTRLRINAAAGDTRCDTHQLDVRDATGWLCSCGDFFQYWPAAERHIAMESADCHDVAPSTPVVETPA